MNAKCPHCESGCDECDGSGTGDGGAGGGDGRASEMMNNTLLDCPYCRTELISCNCGGNKMCPSCDFRVLTIPCTCGPDGLAQWPFRRTDTFLEFWDRLLR